MRRCHPLLSLLTTLWHSNMSFTSSKWWSLHLWPGFYSADCIPVLWRWRQLMPSHPMCSVTVSALWKPFIFARMLSGPRVQPGHLCSHSEESDDRTCSKYQPVQPEWRRVIFRPICPNCFMQNLRKITKNTYLQTWQIFWGSHSNSPCTIFPSPVVECKI